ncbi:MAG: hypothetical protein V7647_766 [Acidobacteriota bacterium]|jgi:hypothetical protein
MRTRLIGPAIVLSAFVFFNAAGVAAGEQRGPSNRAPRITIEDAVDAPSAALQIARREDGSTFPVGVRLEASLTPASREALDARLSQYAARGVAVWIALRAPDAREDVEAWRAALEALLQSHGRELSTVEILLDRQQPTALADYVVRVASTEVRSRRDGILMAIGGLRVASGALAAVYTPQLAPFIDLAAVQQNEVDAAGDLIKGVDPDARIVVTALDAGTDIATARLRLLNAVLESVGTVIVAHAWHGTPVVGEALAALTPVARLITGDISTLDASAAALRLVVGPDDVTATLAHRLLFDAKTFSTYLIYWSEARPEPLSISLTLAMEGAPLVQELARGGRRSAEGYTRNPATGLVTARVPLAGGPVLVDFNDGAAPVFAERTGVSAERRLSIEEIIARHQQQQRAQDALVENYVANVRMAQHFRPNVADPGYDVATTNRYFVARDSVEWEELTFAVNGAKWGADRPPFPLLQPEKVLSLPLQLRFSNDYHYALAGVERVGPYDCYVVRFEPAEKGRSLYRGTFWVDQKTFARVKVQAVQTELSAPVVSNEEIQTYAPVVTLQDRPIFLFTGLTARQIILMAGRNILVEKTVAFTDFEVNTPAFEPARAEARGSAHVMYRETDHGLRYYVKEGEKRVVSERPTRSIRAVAIGTTIDPSYAYPLPMLGINYLNFEFGNPDTQLAILFAGVLGAGNIQRPKIGSTPFDVSVDFFAIAVPSSDRLYGTGGERKAEALLTWPLSTGLNLGWQYTAFQKVALQYQFRFDGYVRDRTTAGTFRVPSSTTTNGLGGAWEYRRAGYNLVLNGTWFDRASWKDWGPAGANGLDRAGAPVRSYTKYSASLSRDWFLGPFQKVHVNGAWFGGHDLDRFAKYQFGMFEDTRLHGVPASGIRVDELRAVRGSYSFNLFEQYRLDLFVDRAWGRDRAFDTSWQPITGLGVAVNFRAPWNTMLRADLGKSVLPPRFREVGSMTLQILILKPLK